jgi:hypothetical protein
MERQEFNKQTVICPLPVFLALAPRRHVQTMYSLIIKIRNYPSGRDDFHVVPNNSFR